MSLSILIDSLKYKVKTLEQAIAQTVQNHHGLIGLLQGTKEALEEATKITQNIAPSSSIAEGLNIANNIAAVFEDAVVPTSNE